LALAEQLKTHPHDLMHKAVGWMIREIGKRDFEVANEFLKEHYSSLPRTALRYAIERFPEELRQDFLKGKF
jgi:3-methyladenine DNA glycosylase AlkD